MKYIEQRKMMIVFICMLISFHNSLKVFESSSKNNDESLSLSNNDSHLWHKDDYDFENLEIMIKNMKSEQEIMQQSFESYTIKVNSLNEPEEDPYSLSKGLKLMKAEFNKAQFLVKELSIYIQSVNSQLIKNKKLDKIGFKEYRNFSKQRRKNGLNLVNKLMRQFLFTDKTKKTLAELDKLFQKLPNTLPKLTKFGEFMKGVTKVGKAIGGTITKTYQAVSGAINNIKKFKWKKKKFRLNSEASQFSKMRMWSSFRINEILNNVFIDEAEGEDVVRAAIISMLSAVPSHFCWVHENRLALADVVCPGNMKRKGSICYEMCEEGYSTIGGFCLSNCPNSYMDCHLFCSKSDCQNTKDLVLKNFKKIEFILDPACPKGYKKKDNLCYPVCEEIGLHTCSDRTCAVEEKNCKHGLPILEPSVLKAFVEFLGHIYSIRSGKNFGWTNPEGLEKAKEIMELKYFWNLPEVTRISKQSIKIVLRNNYKVTEIFHKDVEKIGSSFFKTKDNKPLTL